MSRNKNKKAARMRPQRANNARNNSGKTTNKNRSLMTNGPPGMRVSKLPPYYRTTGDTFSLRLKTSVNLVNTAAGFATSILGLTPGSITTTGYSGLADIFPLLAGIKDQYARFMVSRLKMQLVPTTATTGGGYVAMNYEPDDTNTSSPAITLTDVTSSLHSAVAQITDIAELEVNPALFYNEWRQCTLTVGATTFDSQAGVVQLWCSNANSISTGVAIFQIEVDIHFCGFRKVG